MKRNGIMSGATVAGLFVGSFFIMNSVAFAASDDTNDNDNGNGPHEVIHDRDHRHHNVRLCEARKKDELHCHAHVDSDAAGKPTVSVLPAGFGPAQLLGAYGLSGLSASSNQIIAIVDAYDHPNIQRSEERRVGKECRL